MNPNQASITAENNAALRAYEFMRPKNQRVCSDPFAIYFLSERLVAVRDVQHEIDRDLRGWEVLFPGVCGAIILRTRFIDDCLQREIAAGIDQLVILGAGYDTRAFRFEALRDQITVFELDHPATQGTKLARIKERIAADQSHIRFVPIDFGSERLDAKLMTHGFDPGAKTMFIWEGVTYYISAEAVDRTMVFISQNSAAGSSLVFDYFPVSVVDGTTRLNEARALRAGLKRIGEEILFGIETDRLSDFMTTRGFGLVDHINAADYAQKVLACSSEKRSVSPMFVFAQATVSPAP